MFPVGLGLKNLFISGIIIALIFGLMIFTFYQKKSRWILKLSGFLTIIGFGYATCNSGFSIDNKKPNSIVYIQKTDDKITYFGTYNHTSDSYTEQIFDETTLQGGIENIEGKSKYKTTLKYHKKTTYGNISSSDITIEIDTIIGDNRFLELVITPNRKVNKFEFITNNEIKLKQFKVNDALVNKGKDYNTKKGAFLIYYIANSDKNVTLSFTINKKENLDLVLNEVSYDLLTNSNFSLQPRTEEMMPMPFVTNDAIIISKKLKI